MTHTTEVSADLTRLRRTPDRGSQDPAVVHAILDAGLIAHLGYVVDGRPVVIPTLYGRDGDATEVTDPAAKIAALRQRSTTVLRLPLTHAVAKVRDHAVADDPADLDRDVWAGLLPLRTVAGPLRADAGAEAFSPPALLDAAATASRRAAEDARPTGAPAALRPSVPTA